MKRDYILLAIFAAALLLFPVFVKNAYYLSVMIIVGITLLLVVGLNLVVGYAGQISLGHAGFYGMGAYISMILTSSRTPLEDWLAGFSWMPETIISAGAWTHQFFAAHMVLAPFAAAGLTGLLAMAVAVPTLKLKGHYLAMATLGLGIIIQIIFKEESALTGGPSGLGVPYFKVFGHAVDPNKAQYYYLVWGVVIVAMLLAINLVHSRIGRALRSIHEDELAASASGVPVMRMKVMVFTMSAVYASFAGSLFAHYMTHINPSPFGFLFSVKLVVMVVVGGMGSIWGSVLGTGLMTTLPQFLTVFEEYEMTVYGAILIVVVMFAPNGLAGLISSAYTRIRERGQ